jgi:translation initiation factor 5B
LEIEYSSQKKPVKEEISDQNTQIEDTASNQKKPKETEKENDKGDTAVDVEEAGTVKTAAQKKKEKKEREKQKKLAQKKAVCAIYGFIY